MLMGSARGGVDIEAVAADEPSAIVTKGFPYDQGNIHSPIRRK
jgi:succinyl-CoA synthetase beta subunit